MSQSHTARPGFPKGAAPLEKSEALKWFVDNFGLYIGSSRGLFISDWADERRAVIDQAVINLKSRGFSPLIVTGESLYRQADYLWKESRANSQFGRPLASKVELELGGSDLVLIDNLEAPESPRQLWYLYSHILYPRASAGKHTLITTPLATEEFLRYGAACPDPDFRGKGLNWERLWWLIEATMLTFERMEELKAQSLPPMLKAEHLLYQAMRDRNLEPVPQHVLGDYKLDFAMLDKGRKLDIECDNISALGGMELQRQEAKRNLQLFSDEWQVLKFTTGEILTGAAACVEVIEEVWKTGRKRGTMGRVLTGNTVAAMPNLPVEDEVQHQAITFGGGPVAITGGAGTGKTTCITQRATYLIGQGINPENILILTFAADSQRVLKRSIEQSVEKQAAQRLNVYCWHDLGLRILKENLPAIKRKPPLKIEPSPQKIIQRLLAKAKKDIDPTRLELSAELDEFYIAAVISMYKSHLVSPKQAKEEAGNYSEELVAKIYQALEDQLQKANRIDRDDVIAMATSLLLEDQVVRARYQRQYEFVLVDEYQDVTVAQDMLARLLAAPQENFFVAGDEDEGIAEAKNACPELFTELSLRMPQARCFVLERNWRSHPAIVDHARHLLAGMSRRRINKEFQSAWGQAPTSAVVGPAVLGNEHEEAAWVASEIQLLVDSGRKYGDIAVMFRHHVYATILEEALDKIGVRYQSSNPITNFIPDEVEDMLSFLKLVLDPDGPRARESFERVCQLRIKEIDPKLSGTIASFAEANNLSYLKAVEIYSEATADQACRDLEQLVRVLRSMNNDKLPPAEAINSLRRTQRLNEYYKSVKVPPGLNYEPLKKLNQLEEEARGFKTTAEFVKHVVGQKSGTGEGDVGVQVIPLLESKGLEFPIVFLVGMAEGIFPAQTAADIEEERRICYVGFTRAKELFYVSYPMMFSGAMLQPSQFLVEARLMAAPSPMQMQPAAMEQPYVAYEEPVQPAAMEQPYVPYEEPVQPAAMEQPYVAHEEPVQPAAMEQPYVPYEEPVQPAAMEQPYVAYEEPVQPAAMEQPYVPYEEPVQPAAMEQPYVPYEEPVQPAAMEQPYVAHEEPVAPVFEPPAAPPQLESPKPAKPEPFMDPAAKDRSRPGRTTPPTTEQILAEFQRGRQAADGFQVYLPEDQTKQRPSMPSLPRAKSTGPGQPAASVPEPQPRVEPVQHSEPPAVEVAAVAEPELPVHTAPAVNPLQEASPPSVQPEPQQPFPMTVKPFSPVPETTPLRPTQQPTMPAVPQVQPASAPAAEARPWYVAPEGPAQVEPQVQSPVQPQVQAPVQPQVQAPVQPQVQAPVQPQVQAPVQPQVQAPVQPQVQAPVQPQVQAPVQPQVQAPVQPQVQAPVQPFAPPPFKQQAPTPPVADFFEQAPPTYQHQPQTAHPACPACQNPLEVNARFCGECGFTLIERVPACPTCGVPLEGTAKFCGECGMELNAPVIGTTPHLNENAARMQEAKDKQHGWMTKVLKMLE